MLSAASGLSDAVTALRRLGFSPSGALICLTCGAPPHAGAELHVCRMCKEAWYCDLQCLVRGRAQHEAACAAVIARKAAQKEERIGRRRWKGSGLRARSPTCAERPSGVTRLLKQCSGSATR